MSQPALAWSAAVRVTASWDELTSVAECSELFGLTVEFESKFVPLIVGFCAAD